MFISFFIYFRFHAFAADCHADFALRVIFDISPLLPLAADTPFAYASLIFSSP